MPTLQHRLVRTFVELADTLVGEFDVAELLFTLVERLMESFELAGVGLLLVDEHGSLRPMASSGEEARIMSLLERQRRSGPGYDAFRTGAYSFIDDLSAVASKWPEFVDEARNHGYTSAHAVPMGLRNEVIGAVVLFEKEARLTPDEVPIIRGIADIATIAILQERAMTEAQETADQLRVALRTRVVLEQAKGMIAQSQGLTPEKSFQLLRAYARNRGIRLTEAARQVVEGRLFVGDLAKGPA
jgi:GAF domain-containing protein